MTPDAEDYPDVIKDDLLANQFCDALLGAGVTGPGADRNHRAGVKKLFVSGGSRHPHGLDLLKARGFGDVMLG